MAKTSDKRSPERGGVPAPKARPRRQHAEIPPPRGGHHASTRGGARKSTAKERKARERGEPEV